MFSYACFHRNTESELSDCFYPYRALPFPQFALQPLYQIVGGSGIRLPAHLPQCFQQFIPADRPVLVLHQIGEKIKLCRCKRQGRIVQKRVPTFREKSEPSISHYLYGLICMGRFFAPAATKRKPWKQIPTEKRLNPIVVTAQGQSRHPVIGVVLFRNTDLLFGSVGEF